MDKRAEILSPAGDMERLKMALHYGADAVYLAGREFGMRAAAGNFDDAQLRLAAQLCREKGVKLYVTCNTLPRESELQRLPTFLELLEDCGADAAIVSDLGVMEMVRRYAPHVQLHVSTQFGVTNSAAARRLYDLGASRVVVARELSLEEIASVRANTPKELEIEAFVHGAMCVSFSGRCLLSNYLTGRDANRGACAQPCRWKYHLVEEKRPGVYFEISEDGGTHIMNSRDMCMIGHIPELLDAGITSLKIEGRMKSAYYTAVTTNAYRHALDAALEGRELPAVWAEEVNKVSHREYSTGFYFGEPGQYTRDALYLRDAMVCAIVESCDGEGWARLTQRNKFAVGDTVELVTNDHEPAAFAVEEIFNEEGVSIPDTPHPMMPLRIRLPFPAAKLSILRKVN